MSERETILEEISRESFNDFLGEIRRVAWTFVLPIAFLIFVTFFSCGGAIALVVWAFR